MSMIVLAHGALELAIVCSYVSDSLITLKGIDLGGNYTYFLTCGFDEKFATTVVCV